MIICDMTKQKLKSLLPYAGIPLIGIALFLRQKGNMDAQIFLWSELLIIFGYIAAVIDLKSKKIPNSLVLAMFVAWFVSMIPKIFLDINTVTILLKDAAAGFLLGGGLLLLVYVISRGGLGGGDVKFMAAAGLFLGFWGTFLAMLYGILLAALIRIILLLVKKKSAKDTIPLAPFMYIGILIALFIWCY